MPTLVATVVINDGQTALTTDASVSLSGTGAVAGDLLLVYLDCAFSTNVVTAGPTTIRTDINGASNSATWLLGKLLTAADITAGSVTVTFSNTAKIIGFGKLWRSAAVPSAAQTAMATETTATASPTLPNLTVASGSGVDAAFLRRRSGNPGTVAAPAAYSDAASAATAFGTGTFNVFGTVADVPSSAGGLVGGETASSASTSVGNNYLVEVPASAVSTSIAVPSAFAAAAGAAPAGLGTVVQAPSAFAGSAVSSPAPVINVAVPVPYAYVTARANTASPGVGVTVAVPSAQASVAGAPPPQVTVLGRFQWWDGTTWHVITPRVWDGSQWLVIAVTLTPAIT